LARIVDGLFDLRVAGASGADLLVGRIRRVATCVADRSTVNTRKLPEETLCAPEAAETEVRNFQSCRKRTLQGRTQDFVSVWNMEGRCGAAGQGVGRVDHCRLLASIEQGIEHGVSPCDRERAVVSLRSAKDSRSGQDEANSGAKIAI